MATLELPLRRVDYDQVGTISRGCCKILPKSGGIQVQKVVVASHNGIVYCFGRSKKNETFVIFKTLPGPKIECLTLGGGLGTVQDKIFVACGGIIKGYSKKGKQFFTFETNLTEPITSMHIYGVDMFLCGAYTFNHYHDGKETSHYICGDRINDVICLPVVEGSWVGRGITPVIACEDRTIKVLDGSVLAYEVEIGGPALFLMLFMHTGGPDGSEVLYGTRDGKIGLVDLPKNQASIKWEICCPTGNAGVTVIDCYDMTGDGLLDLVVGRDDGAVDIYVFDEAERPQLKQTFQCHESIMALQCGRISSPNYDEIICCTYAGWIFGLTTEPGQKFVTQAPSAEPEVDAESQQKIQQLTSELELLREKVAAEREKYQANTQSETGISAVPVFHVNDRFQLNKEEAAYILCIELQVPIDYVLLQCDVPIDLLDVDKNSAVVSLTPCEPASGNSLLATYRCQANTTRLEMKIRSIEGQYGTLRTYISPRLHPKCCQVREYNIKPLSLHQRCHVFDQSRPANVLKLSGTFTMAEAHHWVIFCLPDLPDKPPIEDKATFYFLSTFTNTQLLCTYSKGSAVFKSDSISTVAILKDVLSKEATKRKTRLDISCDINEESIIHTLQLIHPKLEYQLNLAKKVHIIEALKELTLHENDKSFLSSDYLDILNNAEKLQSEYKKQQAHLERVYGIITDLYIDKFKFKGQNVKAKVPQLLQILDNYSFSALSQFFESCN